MFLKNQQNELIKIQYNRSQNTFISGANSCMFRQQGAIIRELFSN